MMDGIAAISVFGIMILITADVLSRLILNKPFAGTAEIVTCLASKIMSRPQVYRSEVLISKKSADSAKAVPSAKRIIR